MQTDTTCAHGKRLNVDCPECATASAKLTADIDAVMTPPAAPEVTEDEIFAWERNCADTSHDFHAAWLMDSDVRRLLAALRAEKAENERLKACADGYDKLDADLATAEAGLKAAREAGARYFHAKQNVDPGITATAMASRHLYAEAETALIAALSTKEPTA